MSALAVKVAAPPAPDAPARGPSGLNPDAPSMPAERLLRSYGIETRCELQRALRLPGFTLPFLFLPPILYLFFVVLLGGKSIDARAAAYLFSGFSVFGVMGPGMFGFGIFLASEREQGLLALKRALPAPFAGLLIARMVMTMALSASVMVTMLAVAAVFGPALGPGRLLGVFVVTVLGSLPFCAIGLFLGTLATAKSAPAWVNLTYLPMMYLGGLFFPLPGKIAWVMLLSPAFHLHHLTLAAAGQPNLGAPDACALILLGVTALFSFLAIRRLQREG